VSVLPSPKSHNTLDIVPEPAIEVLVKVTHVPGHPPVLLNVKFIVGLQYTLMYVLSVEV
jgi:hypothetical protein